ncbi:hypothetical protein D3C84_357640 [compost metagenome]
MRHGVGDVGAADLDVAAEQGGGDFAATFEGNVTQVTGVDPGGLGDEGGLHPVLAADGAAGTDHHFARIFLQCLHEVVEGLVGRIAFHRDGAVAGADSGQPAHIGFIETTELALGQVQQRTTGPGHQGAGIGRTLGDHRVVRHRADTAGHVGHAHRFGQQFFVDQRALRQFAGQVETTAGRGRGDAFRAFWLGHELAGEQHTAGGEGETAH